MQRHPYDKQVVKQLQQRGYRSEFISYLYKSGFLLDNQRFTGYSQWGINYDMLDGLKDVKLDALHESGHVVAWIIGRGHFDCVELAPAPGFAGGVKVGWETGMDTFGTLVTIAAGPIAESMAAYGNHTTWHYGASGDFLFLFPHAHDVDLSAVIKQAINIVDTRWETIKLVAEELLRKGKLSFKQCRKIVDP